MSQPLSEPFRSGQRPVVVVFRGPIFNASETFVRAHALGLRRYQPLVVGLEDKGNVPPGLADRVLIRARAADIEAFKPALIHAHFATDGLRVLSLATRLSVPLVTTLHGYDVSRTRASLFGSGRVSWMRYALFQRRLQQRGNLFLAVSEALRQQAILRGFPAARTFTHYNGVDLARFHRGGGGDSATILHVGRLVEKKGTATLLRAFAAVRVEHSHARLVIVGDGPLRRKLERLAGELDLGESVEFTGALPPVDIADRMRRATLLCAPSQTARGGDTEGLPTVVIEAMASGLPVVATDHGGIGEAVADGANGFLIPERAIEPLAHRICELLADAELRARMGTASRAIAEEKFDAIQRIAALEDHYDALLARTRTIAIETR